LLNTTGKVYTCKSLFVDWLMPELKLWLNPGWILFGSDQNIREIFNPLCRSVSLCILIRVIVFLYKNTKGLAEACV
jgi:hypothetical protein